MPRKKAEEQPTEQIEMELVIPADTDVCTAVKKLASMHKTVRSATGDMGEYVNKICDDKDFDKRALSIVRRLDAMPVEKFRITWPHILAYAKALGFEERATAPVAEEQAATESPPDPENVRQFRPPRQIETTA